MVVGAVCGLASGAASAQYYGNFEASLTFDRTSIGIGETATATIICAWDPLPGGTYLSSFNVDLIASGAFVVVSDVAPVAWNNPTLGFNGQGVASGADVIGIQASQFNLIPPLTVDNPLLVTTFRVTGVAEGALSYVSQNAAGAPFPFSVSLLYVDMGPVRDLTNDMFVSQTLVVTPGPGAVGVLGVAGVLGAGRRRR
ncbi:MAG: hypothetical protein LAT64_01170 [Phycisphaerales bacterium]|nr:hypothetical protein [Planctomycetota bacterium]MCH8507373.1 hypothetical protein [Phycisphaerales bacterium]